MADPEERTRARWRPWWLLLLGLLIGLGTATGFGISGLREVLGGGRTRIDQSVVVNRLQTVAKLVTTEAMLRDVVSYQNTFLGSTKRSLVIVTGKALVGFDLAHVPAVAIKPEEKVIALTLPHARLIGIEVLEMKTYDESRGLWNPFHPEDRDTIYLLARQRLAATAGDLGVLSHAEEGARKVLAGLFAADGYQVQVDFAP